MKTFVFFLGGTGSMTAKAFAHLASIGMIKNKADEIQVQFCDKDATNRDTEIASRLIGRVEVLGSAGFLNPIDGNGVCDEKTCFKTGVKQDFFNFSECLEDVIRRNGGAANPDLPLRDWVKDDDNGRIYDQYLLDAFFSHDQQMSKIDVGFKSYANAGDLIYSYLMNNDASILSEISNYIKHFNHQDCKVIIVSSTFGGTGASMFLKTAEAVKALDPARVHVAGVLSLPCFNFPPKDDCIIDPNKFWAKSNTVLKEYSEISNLVKTHYNDDKGLFDRLYLASQPNNELHYCTIGTSEGGTDQMRRTDFIDVVTANYIVDFINAEPIGYNSCCAWGDELNPCSNIYTLKYPAVNPKTPLTFGCIPDLQENMTRMLKFASVIFFLLWSVRAESKLKDVVWLRALMGSGMGPFRRLNYPDIDVEMALNDVLGPIFEYCADFVDFARDLAENGRPTVQGLADFSANYSFFNNVSIRAIWNVKHSLCGGATPCKKDLIVDVLNCKDYCGIDLATSALDTLNGVEIKGLLKDNVPANDAISAYINLLYKNL